MSDKWMTIDSAPHSSSIWVGAACGNNGACGMEPVRRVRSKEPWRNIYTGSAIGFTPTHWMPLPAAPKDASHD
jgi:hypothetical protein